MEFDRRNFLAGSGVLAAGAAFSSRQAQAATELLMSNDYFLSTENPIANRDQKELEALAVELFARPDMLKARERTKADFARVTSNTVSPETWGMLDDWVASYCFRSMQMAVNADANYPRILRVYNPAAKWLGNDVPESRWGMENPDNCYRIIPMEYGGRYVVHGQVQANPPTHSSYVLVADTNTSVTEGLLEFKDLDVAADGTFTITLDDTPADGRRNHIQLTPFARYLFNRDTMGDWMQTPHALRVERLNPPTRGPLTKDEIADRASRVMHDGVAAMYYWENLVLNQPEGSYKPPQLTGPSGGLLTQMSSAGWIQLPDDEAFVVTCDPVEASYFSHVLYDLWGRSLEYRDHFTSLTNAQMSPDADGRFTFVVSANDPGVHNWLQTMGLHDLHVSFRWQGITPANVETPKIASRRVKLAELEAALPQGVRQVTPEQRAHLLAIRRKGFDKRFMES